MVTTKINIQNYYIKRIDIEHLESKKKRIEQELDRNDKSIATKMLRNNTLRNQLEVIERKIEMLK